MTRILIVDDNVILALGLSRSLETEGFSVEIVGLGGQAVQRVEQSEPDLVILDLMLPDRSGFAVLREMREVGFAKPVLILSARGEEVDKVQGFRLGADDYVVKPVGVIELLFRVKAILRRTHPAGRTTEAPSIHRFGNVEVDLAARTVHRAGDPVEISPLEFELLSFLLLNRGIAVSREQLLQEVWGYSEPERIRTRTVDTHVAALRGKLERDPSAPAHILTVRKVGYRLEG